MSSLEFRLEKIDETRNYLLEEIKHNDLMSEKYKKTCTYLNYVEHFLNLASTVTGSNEIRAHNQLVHKQILNHLAKLPFNGWAVLWDFICTLHLSICYYHVTYCFRVNLNTLYSCLNTAYKLKFFIKDFSSKCDHIRNFLWIFSHLLKKPLMKNVILYAVECQGAPCSKQVQYLKFLNDSNEIRTHNHIAHKRALFFTN